eukprot:5882384-Prymnesium_polylepis.1
MVASPNGREGLEYELSASQDGGRVLTPVRLETRRGRLKRCGVRLEMPLGCLEMGRSDLRSRVPPGHPSGRSASARLRPAVHRGGTSTFWPGSAPAPARRHGGLHEITVAARRGASCSSGRGAG